MIIAVDFDGTIVEHRYPKIGRERPFAFATLRQLQAEGHLLTLWSVREGELLDEAVEFCREHGIEFYSVNGNCPYDEDGDNELHCRKVNADMYIDDRNVGGLPDWGVIYEMVHNHWSYEHYMHEVHGLGDKSRPSFWKRVFGR